MSKINTKVKYVEEHSIAQIAGICSGDIIISINNNNVSDILEYKFLINDDYIEILIKKPNNEEWLLEVEKEPYEDLGIIFEEELLDSAKSCKNKCVFCFIDQLPKGLRKTLYFKDDDSRLSFLQGNYISLTNLTQDHIKRIIKYRISPLNVSVHTTNPQLRIKMLNNKNAGNINELLKQLSDGGITLNCQIVLCPNINDNKELDRTIEDLSKYFPYVKSISVVPVGLTKYREGLFHLEPFDKDGVIKVIEQINKWQKKFKDKYNTNLVYLSDEFYLLSQEDFPKFKEYEDFPQIENGVGLISLFNKEFCDYFKYISKRNINIENRNVSIITGASAYNFINNLSEMLQNTFKNLNIKVYKIINNFFGETVTVAGLITGRDIIEQLKDKDLGSELIIPQCMLKHKESLFLDDVTVSDLEKSLNIKIKISPVNGKDFIKSVIGR